MNDNYQYWMILQEKSDLFHTRSASVRCDRRQHLLIFDYLVDKNTSTSSAASTLSLTDNSSVISGQSSKTVDRNTTIYLERIQYIQRGDGTNTGRSARNYHQLNQNGRHRPNQKRLEIFYWADEPRSEYLYKSVSFQIKKLENDFNAWVEALYAAIDEAKNLNEAAKRNRWILREYEKIRGLTGLTLDSLNGWLNSHIGLIGEKANVANFIKQTDLSSQSNEITDAVFKATYQHFVNKQQEILTKTLMSDLIGENRISIEKFAARVTNNELQLVPSEISNIRQSLDLPTGQTEISFKKMISYLWSDANSAFDPLTRRQCTDDMDQRLNHYWISSSHNTYLAKTQLFNPASVHCYIQALLKGCRCIEIDVIDNRTTLEPEITHIRTPIKPIPLRDVLEAIQDYAFVTSEYPIIISIENHCSPEQRFKMAQMFIEIFGGNNALMLTQPSVDADELSSLPSLSVQGHVQIYSFANKGWLDYNYTITNGDVYFAKDDEAQKNRKTTDDQSDEDTDKNDLSNNDLTQIWYHGALSHEEARRLLLSNAGYEVGAFLIRRSLNKKKYCISFLAPNCVVKSIEINERQHDGKTVYALTNKQFKSIPDLIAHYRTYDFAEVVQNSKEKVSFRLGKPLPREKWRQELLRKSWYQPELTREQTEQLLKHIGEEMTFLIRESSHRYLQDYTLSVYTSGTIRHSPIYREGSDFMLMSKTFTSLVEMVHYYSHKPIFNNLTLQNPARPYSILKSERRQQSTQENNQTMVFKPLNSTISLQADKIRTGRIDRNLDEDESVQVELYTCEDNTKEFEGYLIKFKTWDDWLSFIIRRTSALSVVTNYRQPDEIANKTPPLGINNPKLPASSKSVEYSKFYLAEFNKLIIYCQGVKLKELNISKSEDLLDKIKSCKEMISLNFVKATAFWSDIRSMILFNQNHFTRVYPDFSRRSWNSHNFEPIPHWSAGCQMVALNFQMPGFYEFQSYSIYFYQILFLDRQMHYNAGRFAANGGSGYILMPKYIRLFNKYMPEIDTLSMLIKIRVVAVRHLRTDQAKSIIKVQIKITIISKKKSAENQICSTTINGPCGIWDSKQSTSKHDQLHADNRLQSDNSEVDLLYFEVLTDNEDFCGQSTIPLSSLRAGIRSLPLYDKFNERLDMSTLLLDINFKAGIILLIIF
ncbi:unnamed protein product [Adineta steineri]|uniref:Phosphoinositide phospholipase C n=1 Tax=Adineta steineri TaxID=433720 RepID=A0A813Q638_9BILA|nr:unnamed protein product [Adineta steineri]CAF1465230.1 unnamed protein product [Adineta steineri]